MNAEAVRAAAIAYYCECWLDRFRRGHNARSHAIHYGLYESGETDFENAKLVTNAHVAHRLELPPDAALVVADLGCGVGGTAIDLAGRYPAWHFCGIDLTKESIDYARELAERRGVSDRVHFVNANYEEVSLPTRFDGAYAIETACHAVDRERFASRAHALLKPGAPLVIADLFRTERPLDAEARGRYAVLKLGFAIADYYDRDIESVLRAGGFERIEACDLTERMRPGTHRSAEKARRALGEPGLTPRLEAHFAACVAVEQLCESGHLAYRSVRAVRSVGS